MFQIPRGTRDFLPNDMEKRRYIEKNIAHTFTSYGYGEIQTPTFETLELFTAKSGESILNEIYTFTDKGGRQLALRPELTAPVIRCYVERLQMEPKPLKLYYFGNCFRYDRPQKGRYREFQQAGCEIIGTDSDESMAELLALAYTILHNVGLKHIHMTIGNLTIIQALFEKFHLNKDDQKTVLPFIDKSQFDDVSQVLRDNGSSEKDCSHFVHLLQTSDINEIRIALKDNATALTECTRMEAVLTLLRESFQIPKYQIKLSIVRGLDYYKGIVFEIEASVLGAEKQLCGGGAYDLVHLFGGTPVPTTGFAIGFDRTILALESEGFSFPTLPLDIYVIPVNKDMIAPAIKIVQQLRNNGFSVDFDQLQRGVAKSLKYADAKHASKTIIIGPKEINNNSVTLRDMQTGKQDNVGITDLIKMIRS